MKSEQLGGLEKIHQKGPNRPGGNWSTKKMLIVKEGKRVGNKPSKKEKISSL